MAFLDVLLQVAVVVALLHLLSGALVIERRRLRAARHTIRTNLTAVAPTLAALAVVLAVNGILRDLGVELSWLIGVNITGHIYALEGRFVAHLQAFATPALTAYFDFVYVFGYAFLLTFPLVAYVLHDDSRPLRVLLVAYAVNYVGGLLFYIVFVAYGPRNFIPGLVDPLLYTSWPQAQLLTGQVNANTNVFPSLHTSLSVTVALVAYLFRDAYPRWTPVAGVFAASITVSTMYLGIHWATDVVGGVVLACVSVEFALAVTNGVAPRLLPKLRRARRIVSTALLADQ